ncbi:MAG: cell division protein FtsQ/DivIB [Candidatus Binatia bacterium]
MFFHLRDNRKEKGKRGRLLLWGAAVVLLSSTLLLYLDWRHVTQLATRLRDFLIDPSYFSVREIKVRGGERVGGSDIVAMAGLSHGMNIWKIDPENIERKVGKHPWVKRVLVRREFPRRVVIEVEERVVKGIVVLGKLYYVDSAGFVFKEVGKGEKVDFPLLTGLQQADLASQPHSTRQKIQEALRLGDLVARGSLALSEIHFRPRGGVVLYPMAYPVALRMGWGDWQGKVQRLQRVLAVWKGKEDRLAALDLSFRDQVVARVRRLRDGG